MEPESTWRPYAAPLRPRITGDLEEILQGLEEITRQMQAPTQQRRWRIGLFVGGQRVVAVRQEHDRHWWWIRRNQDVRSLLKRLEAGGAATVALAAPDDMDPEDRASPPRRCRPSAGSPGPCSGSCSPGWRRVSIALSGQPAQSPVPFASW